MKKFVRSSAVIACAVLSLSFGASTSARADGGDMVRMAQMRLADLGYYAGYDDGVMGPQTRIGIRDFQAYNGLPLTGELNSQTYNLLLAADFRLHHGNTVTQIAYTPAVPQYVVPAITPMAYTNVGYTNTAYAPIVAEPTVSHVAYYEDGNGYQRYVASPSMPVAYTTPVAAAPLTWVNDGYSTSVAVPSVTPVAYYGNGYTTGYIDAAWHY